MNNIRKIEIIMETLQHTKDIIRDLYRDESGRTNWHDCPEDIKNLMDVLIDQTSTLDAKYENEFWWNK